MRITFVLLVVIVAVVCLSSFTAGEKGERPLGGHGNRGREVRLHNKRRRFQTDEDDDEHHEHRRGRHYRHKGDPHGYGDHDSHETHDHSHDHSHESHGQSHGSHHHSHESHDHSHDSHDHSHSHSHESHQDSHSHSHYSSEDSHDHDRDHRHNNHTHHHHQHKIFTFQVGDNFGPYEYIDDEGKLRGFYIDLIKAVCDQADHECEVVFDSPENCWTSRGIGPVEKPGYGLMAGLYDGCMGYSQSPERMNSFTFSEPFSPNHEAHLYATDDYDKCDPIDVKQLKIGFIDGWAINRHCLARQWDVVGHKTDTEDGYVATISPDNQGLLANLLRKNTDAIFSIPEYVPENMNLKPLCGRSFTCTKAGLSLMTRKDSTVVHWWNKAFKTLQESGEFQTLCEESNIKHEFRGKIKCI